MAAKYKQGGAQALSRVPLGAPPKKGVKSSDSFDLAELRAKIAALQKLCDVRKRTADDLTDQIASQTKENERLLQQITEMTNFLADYGLHWRGGPGPQFATFPNGPLDMELFQQRIRDLNSLAGSAPMFRLTLHNEGFTVNDGELRAYGEPSSGLFIQDIVDGFFPGEFKAKYPMGVKFQVNDRRNIELFQGPAKRLIQSARSPKEVLGKGDGKLKVRVPDAGDLLVMIEPGTKVRQIRRLVQHQCGFDDFEFVSPPSALDLDDNAKMSDLGLYPRGLIVVKR